LFALARNAMYAACRILRIGPGDEILTPAFDCDGALQPFTAIGCGVKFFRSDPFTFAVDVQDIKKQITPATRLIHIVNHFGIAQQWDELCELRKSSGIPILEDNAYSLFSSYNGRPLGEFGDFSVFSFRKNLPVVDGGMLRINNPAYQSGLPVAKPGFFYRVETTHMLNLLKRKLGCYKLPPALKRILGRQGPASACVPLFSENGGVPDVLSRDRIGEEFSCDYLRPMSKLALWQLRRYTPEMMRDIARNKIRYYMRLNDELKGIPGIRLLMPDIAEGAVPFSVFMLIDAKRDVFYESLSAQYEVLAWPTLPGPVIARRAEYPEITLLGTKLLQLNLSADRVCRPDYPAYVTRLAADIRRLAEKHLR
jgi:hypothetical protein